MVVIYLMQVTWLLLFHELLLCAVVAAVQILSSESVETCVDYKCDIVMANARRIVKKVLSVEQAEGVGARVRRSVGRPEVIYIKF